MYSIILAVHNIVRWVAVILGVVAIVKAYIGWFGKREWTDKDRKFGSFFSMALDIQLLLGLSLYLFLSPKTTTAFQDISAAMQVSGVRYFLLVHPLCMILAVIFAHLGNILARKADEDSKKFRQAALWFSLSGLAIILGMPWTARILPGF